MSDFLVRLARRAAGLDPTAVPRPPHLPAELLVVEPGAADEPAVWPATAEVLVDSSPAAPTALLPSGSAPREPSLADAAYVPASELSVAPPAPVVRTQALGQALPVPRAEPCTEAKAAPTASPHSVTIVAPEPEPRPERVSDESVRRAPEPPMWAGALEPRVGPAPEPDFVTPVPRAVDRVAEAPLPLVAVGPCQTPLVWPAGKESTSDEEPAIQVHIGRIEIMAPLPPLLAAAAPRPAPRGFDKQGLARRHLDRRWY